MVQEARRLEIQLQGIQLANLILQEQSKGNLQTVRIVRRNGISRLSSLVDVRGGMATMGSTGAGKTILNRT